jgi:hypothetical protein
VEAHSTVQYWKRLRADTVWHPIQAHSVLLFLFSSNAAVTRVRFYRISCTSPDMASLSLGFSTSAPGGMLQQSKPSFSNSFLEILLVHYPGGSFLFPFFPDPVICGCGHKSPHGPGTHKSSRMSPRRCIPPVSHFTLT